MNILTRYAEIAKRQPKKLALITEKNQLNYEELLQFVQILDLELTSRDIRPGQTIAVALDVPELVIGLSFLVSLRGYTMIFALPKTVTGNGVTVDAIVSVKHLEGPESVPVIQVAPDWFAPMGTLAKPDYSQAMGGGTFVFQSSGSTGLPKLIATTEEDRLYELDHYPIFGGQDDRSKRRLMHTLSAATSAGLWVAQDTLLHGGTVALVAEDKEKLLQYIDLWRVDTLLIAPATAEKFLTLPNPAQYLTSLQRVMFMGANSSAELREGMAALSSAEVRFGYGLAEIGPVCRSNFAPGKRPPDNYVGEIVRDDLEFAFLDDTFQVIDGATEGLLAIRRKDGAKFMRRYVGSGPEAENAGMINGWLVPGDLMRRDGNALYFLGRAKNVINFGGRKIALELIEATLAPALAPRRIVALNRVSASGQDELVVVCEGETAISLTEIDLVLSQVARGISATASVAVNSFPISPSGKIDRRTILQMI